MGDASDEEEIIRAVVVAAPSTADAFRSSSEATSVATGLRLMFLR